MEREILYDSGNNGMVEAEAVYEAPAIAQPGTPRVIAVVALLATALLSFFLLGNTFSSPDTYEGTIQSLDDKKATVLALTAASTAASAALSATPDDTFSPIAGRLADLSGDFLIVLIAIYLEKYLLTVAGLATFKVLVPLSCALAIIGLFLGNQPGLRRTVTRLAAKLTLLGLAILVTVPVSVLISNSIEATYQDSIDDVLARAQVTQQAAEETAQAVEAPEAENPVDGAEAAATSAESSDFGESVSGFFQDRVEEIASVATGVGEAIGSAIAWLEDLVNAFIESLAIMIILSCVIPVLVLAFFLWVVSLVLGLNVDTAMGMLKPRSLAGGMTRIGRGR